MSSTLEGFSKEILGIRACLIPVKVRARVVGLEGQVYVTHYPFQQLKIISRVSYANWQIILIYRKAIIEELGRHD